MLHPYLRKSGRELAALIRNGQATSREIIDIHIAHIERINPFLNAMVRDRFDQARQDADAADQKIAEGSTDLPPYHGVPCSIKESFALEGMPNTSGLVSRQGQLAKKNATTVERLLAAGAIPLGVTNISELCMWMESDNQVYGRSNNPYNIGHIVGGSSGGEGALIGAAGSPFGLGSDIGGSIRMPAFFNGVFGHKPTGGMVPATGQFPIAENEALRYLATGPLARHAEDLFPLLKIMAGPDGQDPSTAEYPLKEITEVDWRDLTVLNVTTNGIKSPDPDMAAAQAQVADFFRRRGARVVEAEIPELKKSLEIWSSRLSKAGGKSYAELMGGHKGEVEPMGELFRWLTGRSEYTLPSIGLALLESVAKLLPGQLDEFHELGTRLKENLVNRLGDKGVMLYPPYPSVAPRHREPLLPPFYWVYTAVINALEMPATQVPLGLNRKGLPLGVQLIGKHGNDSLTIALARELEMEFGGWTPPDFAYAVQER